MATSQDVIIKARQVNLVEYLRVQNYQLKHEGGQNYRVCGMSGLIVQGNHWYCHRDETGGNAIDFVTKIEGYSFQEAIKRLSGVGTDLTTNVIMQQHRREESTQVGFQLPAAAKNNKHIILYLVNERKIPIDLVRQLIAQKLLFEDNRDNCVFVCLGQKAAVLRGTDPNMKWRGMVAGSDASYPWVWPTGGNTLVICESPIDCMSLHALHPRNCIYVSVNGLRDTALRRAIHTYRPKHIVLSMDNDEAGRTVSTKWQKQLEKAQITVTIEKTDDKDWNETLSKFRC